jgi:hypothetical protein
VNQRGTGWNMFVASRNESRPSSPAFLSVSLKSVVANRRGYWKALSEMFQAENLLCNLLNLASNHTLIIAGNHRAARFDFASSHKCFGPKSAGWMSFPSDCLSRSLCDAVVRSSFTRFQIQPASCFAILQYKSMASASCCFSMYSPAVCAT